MLSSGQGAEVRAHIAQIAARREGGPFLCSRVFQTVFTVIGVIETAHGLAILRDELTGIGAGAMQADAPRAQLRERDQVIVELRRSLQQQFVS